MQPSADSLHLGNYLGALVNWVRMQDEYDAVFFIPTCTRSPFRRTRPTGAAAPGSRPRSTSPRGIDPDKCTLFVQSQVPEHAQLAWVLNCITGFGEASRMTQFKDKAAKQGSDRPASGCSPTRSCRPRTSCCTSRTVSRSARTSASTWN